MSGRDSIPWVRSLTVGAALSVVAACGGDSGFLVAHYSDRTALAISDTFKFPGTIPAFVYGN